MTDLLPEVIEAQPTIVKTLVAVAKAFERSPGSIQQWKKLGMPVEGDGTYDIERIAKWRSTCGLSPGVNRDVAHDRALNYEGMREVTDHYKINRADIFAAEQASNISIQKKLKEKKLTDAHIDGLSVNEALNWFRALGVDFGIKYDKERLERGESTENVAVIVGAIKEWKKRKLARKH